MKQGIVNMVETQVEESSLELGKIAPINLKDAPMEATKVITLEPQKGAFKMRGRYQILSLKPKPEWIPDAVWLGMVRDGKADEFIISRSPVIENLIMLDTNKGLNLIMQHLNGVTTYPLEIDSLAIGTGTNAPTSTDSGLQTPVFSGVPKAIGNLTAPGVWYSEWFITDGELADGTYNELGLFCGSQIFTRSIITPAHVKAAATDTLIVYTITASNA